MTTLAAARLFIARDFTIAKSYRVPFLFTVLSSLMSLVTFHFISKMVGGSAVESAGGDYFGFVVVGLALANVLDSAVSGPAQSARQEQVQGTLEILATQPISPASLASGWASYPLVIGFANGFILLALAGPMGLRLAGPDIGGGILALAVSAAAFAGVGMLGAAIVLVFQQGATILQWFTSALALVSGVYFPLKLLPGWMRVLAEGSPLTHSVRAVRGSLLEGKGVGEIGGDLLALALLAVVLLPVSIAGFSLALQRARTKGTIASY